MPAGPLAPLPEVTGELGTKPSIEVFEGAPPPELVIEDLVVGEGDVVIGIGGAVLVVVASSCAELQAATTNTPARTH